MQIIDNFASSVSKSIFGTIRRTSLGGIRLAPPVNPLMKLTQFRTLKSFLLLCTITYLLGCSASHHKPYCIIRPRRSRSASAYSRQAFPWTICRSVCLSVQCIVENRRIGSGCGLAS